MLVHHRDTPSSKFAGTHLYTWVERGTIKGKEWKVNLPISQTNFHFPWRFKKSGFYCSCKKSKHSIYLPTPPEVRAYTLSLVNVFFISQDLCQLTNGEQPYWLIGITEMTRTFGLELLESVLKGYPNIFLKVC